MELHWVRPDLLNTVFRDEHGRPHYRTETNGSAFGIAERTTTISRFVDVDPSLYSATERVTTDDKSDTDILINRLREQPVAQIVWRRVSQSIFKYNAKEVKAKDLMTTKTATLEKYVALRTPAWIAAEELAVQETYMDSLEWRSVYLGRYSSSLLGKLDLLLIITTGE